LTLTILTILILCGHQVSHQSSFLLNTQKREEKFSEMLHSFLIRNLSSGSGSSSSRRPSCLSLFLSVCVFLSMYVYIVLCSVVSYVRFSTPFLLSPIFTPTFTGFLSCHILFHTLHKWIYFNSNCSSPVSVFHTFCNYALSRCIFSSVGLVLVLASSDFFLLVCSVGGTP
jgi:hypothetical protein